MPTDPSFEFVFDCNRAALPSELAQRFVRVELDDEARAYLERSAERRAGRALTTLQRTMTQFMSDFDANGLLGLYPMHLLGTRQWRELIGHDDGRRHLDVGAGSGDVTATLAPLSGETVTTETSWAMSRVLRRRGFDCVRTDVAASGVPRPSYGVVTALNVIDRCARPRTLLENLSRALTPDGLLVVATPFPFNPFVYDGPVSERPREELDVQRASWESSVTALVENVLDPLDLDVVCFSRTPYLSGGDAKRPFYVLDDAVLVCRKRAGAS